MNLNQAGIDVGAKTLTLATRAEGKTQKFRDFANDPTAHAAVIQALRQARVTRMCLEATGVYHLDLAVALHDAGGFEVMVVNPKAARRFAEAMMTRTKTDPVDAVLALRAFGRYLASLTQQRTQLKNQLHAWQHSQATPEAIVQAVTRQIQDLDLQLELIRAQALQLILHHPALHQPYQLLVSVKGIAQASAIALLGELLVLPDDLSARQWVAMAGLDPRHHRSGTRVNKKPRISKAGNRYLRNALYMPALSATRHDAHLRGFYQHLIEHRGLKKLQAVCAVMRKLLTALHAMLATGMLFDGSRLFALPPEPTSADA